MPDVKISVGGKSFTVACRAGEEEFLQTAAAMLDAEAQALLSQIGRIDEPRMLLMAGLMLADRTAAFEDRALAAEQRVAELEKAAEGAAPRMPQGLADSLLVLATRAEGLADRTEAAAS